MSELKPAATIGSGSKRPFELAIFEADGEPERTAGQLEQAAGQVGRDIPDRLLAAVVLHEVTKSIIAGVIEPAPPNMLNGTQPGVALQRRERAERLAAGGRN